MSPTCCVILGCRRRKIISNRIVWISLIQIGCPPSYDVSGLTTAVTLVWRPKTTCCNFLTVSENLRFHRWNDHVLFLPHFFHKASFPKKSYNRAVHFHVLLVCRHPGDEILHRLHLSISHSLRFKLINIQSAHTFLDIVPKIWQMQVVQCEILLSYTTAEIIQCIGARRVIQYFFTLS